MSLSRCFTVLRWRRYRLQTVVDEYVVVAGGRFPRSNPQHLPRPLDHRSASISNSSSSSSRCGTWQVTSRSASEMNYAQRTDTWDATRRTERQTDRRTDGRTVGRMRTWWRRMIWNRRRVSPPVRPSVCPSVRRRHRLGRWHRRRFIPFKWYITQFAATAGCRQKQRFAARTDNVQDRKARVGASQNAVKWIANEILERPKMKTYVANYRTF